MSDISYLDVKPPYRILLGPGPSNIHPRVQRAMIAPLVGHLDPYFATGIDDLRIRQRLLDEYSIDIWGGFGKLEGQIWRIGLMGFSSTEENVLLVLFALEKLLAEEGYPVEPGAGVTAAIQALRKEYCTVALS